MASVVMIMKKKTKKKIIPRNPFAFDAKSRTSGGPMKSKKIKRVKKSVESDIDDYRGADKE